MTVYVDNAMIPFGRMLMCHMWADSDVELLAMAQKIGVASKWIQGHPTLSIGKHRKASWVHFDVCKDKQKKAIHYGAKLTDVFGPVEHTAKLMLAKGKIEGNQLLIDNAKEQLRRVTDARARRQTQGELQL